MEAEIAKIEGIGDTIGKSLNEKILRLTNINNGFNKHLLEKLKILNDLANQIRDFREQNANELKTTKDNLAQVTVSLTQTKEELGRTKAALDEATLKLSTLQQELMTTNEEKSQLSSKIAELNAKITQTEFDYKQQIANITNQKNDEMKQQRDELEKEYDERIGNLNREKTEIQQQLEETARQQNVSQQKISAFESEQQSLIQRLAAVNEMLVKQLSMINEVIAEPDYNEYNTLLESIESALMDVLQGIKKAVSETTGSISGPPGTYSNVDVEQNYTKLLNLKNSFSDITSFRNYLSKHIIVNNKKEQLPQNFQTEKDNLSEKLSQVFKTTFDYTNIKKILQNSEIVIPAGKTGGKRKRKTMKKRPRKTRKHMKKHQKGGYIYNKNDKLDKASSDVSDSSNSTSGTNSKTNKINKTNKKRYGKSRSNSITKRRSRK
jgi:hypothetical protein